MSELNDFLKKLHPKMGEIEFNEKGTLTTTIVDAEMDGIKCKFHNDGCVEIDSDEYTYLTLTKANLLTLINIIDSAEEIYDGVEDDEE